MEELFELNKHECTIIRSNLMEIASCAQRLELALEDADVYEEMGTVNRILDSCYKVLSAVINSEEMAKLDDYTPAVFCVSDLVDDMLSICNAKLRRSDIEIISEVEKDVFVEADADRLTACLMNLIVNAINNVDQDEGEVKVKVSKLNGSAAVTVADNGYGADLDELEEYLTDDEGKTGLSVVGKFCRAANTNLIVDDGAEGGLIFSFRLPLAKDADVSLKSRKSFIPDNSFSPVRVYLAKVEDYSEE